MDKDNIKELIETAMLVFAKQKEKRKWAETEVRKIGLF